jgi:hypothetical protein
MASNTAKYFKYLPLIHMETSKYPKDYSGTPNLGGKKLKLNAKSDAANIYCIPAHKVANGEVAMPFRHAEFAAAYYKERDPEFYKRFELIAYFSKHRNHRIMKKINKVLAKIDGKKQFTITSEMETDDEQYETHRAKAISLGVNPQKYVDIDMDDDDVAQSTNSWCLNQQTIRGKASDNIVIITDLDDVDWFILIQRQFGPGCGQAAWAGGFVDNEETFTEAALREKDEETTIEFNGNTNVTFSVTTTELSVIISNDWDPRAKFVEGMENGAVVTHYVFTKINERFNN